MCTRQPGGRALTIVTDHIPHKGNQVGFDQLNHPLLKLRIGKQHGIGEGGTRVVCVGRSRQRGGMHVGCVLGGGGMHGARISYE